MNAVAWLRSPDAVRRRAEQICDAAERGTLTHFALAPKRLDAAASFVIETIESNYPDLDIPYHSRWRHFAVGGRDRWARLEDTLDIVSHEEIARIRIDLVVTSVLLDAGAGKRWSYREAGTSDRYQRSEGLAVASFDAFAGGVFSSHPDEPLRADEAALRAIEQETLARAFQVSTDNRLVGLDGRTELLRRLGAAIAQAPELFGEEARVGNLFDWILDHSLDGKLPAARILEAVLIGLGPIWPGRIELDGVNLGDVWRHPAAGANDSTDGLVPFHKLSQWLTYSLVEPLHDAGIEVTQLDELTGLPEYRNGGLLLDSGVLMPKHEAVLSDVHTVDSELVVEWRALTVALLDRLGVRIRERLGLSDAELPLAKVLEGGTWSAGRRIARERRPDGGPPIRVYSDGTVF